MNWWEAYAFCIWDGGFLPSEAEWEYAAAGGSQQREYPWGTAAPGTGNQYAIYGSYYPPGSLDGPNASVAPVGTPAMGVGLWGQLDLAGNVWEWNLDYAADSYVDPCIDCADLTEATFRVARGGGYVYAGSLLVPPYRGHFGPSARYSYTGVRCARAP